MLPQIFRLTTGSAKCTVLQVHCAASAGNLAAARRRWQPGGAASARSGGGIVMSDE